MKFKPKRLLFLFIAISIILINIVIINSLGLSEIQTRALSAMAIFSPLCIMTIIFIVPIPISIVLWLIGFNVNPLRWVDIFIYDIMGWFWK